MSSLSVLLTPPASLLQHHPGLLEALDNSGPDVASICLLGWAFCRASRSKEGRKDPILETHKQVLLMPPAAPPPLGTPPPATLRKEWAFSFMLEIQVPRTVPGFREEFRKRWTQHLWGLELPFAWVWGDAVSP